MLSIEQRIKLNSKALHKIWGNPQYRPSKPLILLSPSKYGGRCPTNEDGDIPTKEEWERIKQECDQFYQKHSDEKIDAINGPTCDRINGYNPDGYNCYVPSHLYMFMHVEGWTYWFQSHGNNTKIGHTSLSLYQRAKQVAHEIKSDIFIIGGLQTPYHYEVEQQLHMHFWKQRKEGEWFDLTEQGHDLLDLAASYNDGVKDSAIYGGAK